MKIRGFKKLLGGCLVGLLMTASAAGAQVLTFVDRAHDGVGGIDGLDGTRGVAVSPDGDNIYTAAELDNAVAVWARDRQTGAFTQIQLLKDGENGIDGIFGASNLAISPDGRNVYVGGTFEAALAVFDRDPASGLLEQIQILRSPADAPAGLAAVVWTGVSGDGRNVYTASAAHNAVNVYRRDPSDGTLTFVQIVREGEGGIDSMLGTIFGAISPDGKNVYVTARLDDAVTVFERDRATGALTLKQAVSDSQAGVDGLDGARAAVVSRNGQQVYVVSLLDHSVAVFDRDRSTGEISFVQVLKDNTGGINGLRLPVSVVETPDGEHVFVAAFGERSISVYERRPATGRLEFVEFRHGGDAFGTEGLSGVLQIVVSPDGKHLYAGTFLEDSLVYFDIVRGN